MDYSKGLALAGRGTTAFEPVRSSLRGLLGEEYVEGVCAARALLAGEDAGALRRVAEEEVEFFPDSHRARLDALLGEVGNQLAAPIDGRTARGATSRQFKRATKQGQAPVGGLGCFRLGEDGRLYLIAKSEHYHTPLGHGFPGYRLIDNARRLGILNATHNNTRGHVTRLLEEKLVLAANGEDEGDGAALDRLLATEEPGTINRVLNLETGSLAVEAAVKMMLARFYRSLPDDAPPPHEGKIPVFLVMGNDQGEPQANYHGTTVLTQCMRGLWPEMQAKLTEGGLWKIVALRPNRAEEVRAAFEQYEQGPYKIAGFIHEIVMMNYGGRLLSREYLTEAYGLCRRHNVPTLADEIQSCLWSPGYFMSRNYGLRPSFIAIGKGFPGGEYPASKILFSADMDNLAQFGALVTNGQEELASLAYLVTMAWARANREPVRALGEYYEQRMNEVADRFRAEILGIEGKAHMLGIRFEELGRAQAFAGSLNRGGIDISVQSYKEDCPPVALTKLPMIADEAVIDLLIERMTVALRAL